MGGVHYNIIGGKLFVIATASARVVASANPLCLCARAFCEDGVRCRRAHHRAVCNCPRAVATTAISQLATTSWSCCVDGTMPMGAMISPLFRRHRRHRRRRGVRGNHCNFHSTRSSPAEDGIADHHMMGRTNVVMPSAGKEVATTTPGHQLRPGRLCGFEQGQAARGEAVSGHRLRRPPRRRLHLRSPRKAGGGGQRGGAGRTASRGGRQWQSQAGDGGRGSNQRGGGKQYPVITSR